MNYLVLILIFTSLGGLFLIYFAALNIQPEEVKIGEISGELVGRKVSTSGYIKSEKLHEDGHLFLTITDGKRSVQVPIFSSLMQHLDQNDFKEKTRIRVTGVVDEYRSQLQIVPRKPQDVSVGN